MAPGCYPDNAYPVRLCRHKLYGLRDVWRKAGHGNPDMGDIVYVRRKRKVIIDGEKIINFQFYDEEHEEYSVKPMKIIDFLERYSEEAVPTIEETAQSDAPDTNVGDMIFRQDAIDVTWEKMTYNEPWNVLTEVRKRLKALPSAQPEGKSGVFIPDITVENLRKAPLEAVGELLVLGEMKDIVLPYTQPEPKWIPVEERLPEESGSYPVWTARGFGNHLSASYWDGKEWTLRVVAWMPIEPYERSEDA